MSDALLALTLLAWLAYIISRLVRRSAPELIAFLLVGIVLGPSALGVIDTTQLQNLTEVTAVALAFLMFIIGERVAPRAIRRRPWVLVAGIVQYAVAAVAVYVGATAAGAERDVALLLAALGGAGAPLTVQAVVTSVGSKARFAQGLVGVHAVADALTAVTFAALLAFIAGEGGEPVESVGRFLRLGVGGVALGLVLGWVVARLTASAEATGENLVIVLVHVLIASAAAGVLGVSLPLAALTMGGSAVTFATSDAAQRTFVAARSIEQPLYLLFFGLAGASIHLDELTTLGGVGLAYLAARSLGKLAGGFLGGLAGRLRVRRAVMLGVDLIPQAGVAIGLAVLVAEVLPEDGTIVSSVVLGSVVVFELVGPLLVERDLRRLTDDTGERDGSLEEVDHSIPRHVFVSSAVTAEMPDWIVDMCARNHSELIVAGHGSEDVDVVSIRDRAQQAGVPFRWVELTGESFSGPVIRAAREADADLVVLIVGPDTFEREHGIAAAPYERITRHLARPTLIIPAMTAERRRPGPVRRLGERLLP